MITAVILAAGESARLGHPKQLLEYNDSTLVGHVISTALASDCDDLLVILGAHMSAILPEIRRFNVKVVENCNWPEGKASSIRTAVTSVESEPGPSDGILFLTCDQPNVTPAVLNQLIRRFQQSSGRPVFSAYADTVGIPAIIPRRLFPNLMALRGDQGAQAIVGATGEEVIAISFSDGALDIDSEKDLQSWRAGSLPALE